MARSAPQLVVRRLAQPNSQLAQRAQYAADYAAQQHLTVPTVGKMTVSGQKGSRLLNGGPRGHRGRWGPYQPKDKNQKREKPDEEKEKVRMKKAKKFPTIVLTDPALLATVINSHLKAHKKAKKSEAERETEIKELLKHQEWLLNNPKSQKEMDVDALYGIIEE